MCLDVLRLPVFFFVLLPPPSSTLFPYTTLFRSNPSLRGSWGCNIPSCCIVMRPLSIILRKTAYNRLPNHWTSATPTSDRKSTRLNSSHVRISYAVFCLKKKKDTGRLKSAHHRSL